MASVTLQNKTFGVILIGLKNEQDPNQTDTLRIKSRERLSGIESTRLTSYTEGLIRKGILSVQPELG